MRPPAPTSVVRAAIPSPTSDMAAKKCMSAPPACAPGEQVRQTVQQHAPGGGQQPQPRNSVALDAGHQQRGCDQVQGDGDENDCHRGSVAQRRDEPQRRVARNREGPPGYTSRPVFCFHPGSACMFESLTQRLSGTIERLRGRGRLTEENIRESLREVRIALLEADVALPVVQALIERIKVRAVGQEVLKSLTPGQALIKVVRDELTAVMGSQAADLNLNVPAPAVILMAGLQGAGKTTTVAKLAKHLKEKRKKKVMVVSARRLPSGRHRAAQDARAAGGRAVLPVLRRPEAGRHRSRRHRRCAQVLRRRAAGRHRRPHQHRRSDDGRDQGPARRGQAGRDAVRGRFDDRPGRGRHRQGTSAKRCR